MKLNIFKKKGPIKEALEEEVINKMKYFPKKLQRIIEQEDPWKGDLNKFANGWQIGALPSRQQDIYRSGSAYDKDLQIGLEKTGEANTYQSIFENLGLIGATVFNQLDLEIPEKAQSLYLGIITDTIRDAQKQCIAFLDRERISFPENLEERIEKIVKDTINKRKEIVEKVIPAFTKELIRSSGITFENKVQQKDSIKGYLYVSESIYPIYTLFHPENKSLPDFESSLEKLF